MEKECKHQHPEFKVRYFCKECSLPLNLKIFSMRFQDSCSGGSGVTSFDGQHKIWKCEHYVYCPLCGWRCKDVLELKKHIEMWDSKENRHLCEGWWRYGNEGTSQVLNEIKYWEELRTKKVPRR